MKLNYIYRKNGLWVCVQTDGINHTELEKFQTLEEASSFMHLMFIDDHMIEMNTTEKSNLINVMKSKNLWPPFKIDNQILLDQFENFHLLKNCELLEIITGNIDYADICEKD